LVPFKKWRIVERNLCVNDIVLVMYDRKIGKADYRLARILEVHPDDHGIVRTVTVGMRRRDRREAGLPYQPKPLEKLKLGVQRLAVVCPAEVQQDEVEKTPLAEENRILAPDDNSGDGDTSLVAEESLGDVEKILDAEERTDNGRKILVAEERTSMQ